MADAENIVNTGSPKIQMDSDDTSGTGDKLTIVTGSGETELVRVQEDGKIGVGTPSPVEKVSIVGSGSTETTVVSNPTVGIYDTAGNTGLIVRKTDTNTEGQFIASDNDVIIGAATTHNLLIRTDNATRIKITSDGKVGVGVASPDGKLDVCGGVKITDDGYLNMKYNSTPGTPDDQEARIFVSQNETKSSSGWYFPQLQATVKGKNSDNGKSLTRTINISNLNWFNVWDFGAHGNGHLGTCTDDTAAFQSAINVAKANKGVVYVPKGTYKITSTLMVIEDSDATDASCLIVGENRTGTVIAVDLANATDPVFGFESPDYTGKTVGVMNLSIKPYDGIVDKGKFIGLYLNGLSRGIFRDLNIADLKYGIFLHNSRSLGAKNNESNEFNNIRLLDCDEGIRLEQSNNDNSFHGNVFQNCFFNIDAANHIGFHHVSGVYYNGRFSFFMWNSAEAVYLRADGDARHNIGSITSEGNGKIAGDGRFHYSGYLHYRYSDTITVEDEENTRRILACDNFWFEKTYYGSGGLTAGPMLGYNGHCHEEGYNFSGFFQRLTNKGSIESVVLTTPINTGNGLYLGYTNGAHDIDTNYSGIGMLLSSTGDKIKSYNTTGMAFDVNNSSNVLYLKADGCVGIGNPTPDTKLQVDGSNDTIIKANITSGHGNIALFSAGTEKVIVGYAASAHNYGAQTAAGDISIKANNTNLHIVTGSGNANTALYVKSSGEVGIGTTAPTSGMKLDVAGNIKASGSVQVGNNSDGASASNVGAIRYRTSGNYSYVDICMQYGSGFYRWENIKTLSW
uniref:Pectin lyase fold-containing protein n=2 Tax=uncultured microorganism TaxID=358574 RepID=F8UGX6_9ZZZZ|nr:pectin lyase fold-containing protein [uncultured microorganism]